MKYELRLNPDGSWQYALVGSSGVPIWNANRYESEDEARDAALEVLGFTSAPPPYEREAEKAFD